MDDAERSRLNARSRKVERVLSLLRDAVPAGDLDGKDWEALRVATRLVYETEDLRMLLCSKEKCDRDFAISYWVDSMESGLEFMSWTKQLASIARESTYSKEPLNGGVEGLWERHRKSATRLLTKKMSPERRLSLLVELGGIELSLLGRLWWLEPSQMSLSRPQRETREAKRHARKALRGPGNRSN